MSVINVISKVLPAVGIVLFLCSMVFPFLELNCLLLGYEHIPENTHSTGRWWSFRRVHEVFGLNPSRRESWFFDYWFADPIVVWYGLTWVLFSMFLVQVFTLITGSVSIFKNSKVFALTPAILCPITIGLLIIVHVRLCQDLLCMCHYLPGYWCTYPSEAIFIINFLLKRKIRNFR